MRIDAACAKCGRASDDETGWTITADGPVGIVCPTCSAGDS